MPTKQNLFNFNSTYLDLPSIFYSFSEPEKLVNPELVYFNQELANLLSINQDLNQITTLLSGDLTNFEIKTFAQAYAGHQFGHFNLLGDGRAILLGEHLSEENKRTDIQLKGAGRTAYSRGGDGKATINAMLREYLISEAMHYLNIPTSRSLAVLKSNELIYRTTKSERSILCRVMSSHIRVGTFQFAVYYGGKEDLLALLNYTVKRHFPEILGNENLALAFLEKVMKVQIELVTNWLRVGFIHGVMNTDNTSIAGETFDYGPCAFINTYNPKTVFSSIDVNERYSFSNQPIILKWNLIKLAESLLEVIDVDTNKSIEKAQELINQFDELWENSFYQMMSNKLGLDYKNLENKNLINDLLHLMQLNKLDYTNTFNSLLFELEQINFPLKVPVELNKWKNNWKISLQKNGFSVEESIALLKKNNPVFIPRNHLVEKAILNASNNNYLLFNGLLEVYKNPYDFQVDKEEFLNRPLDKFEETYKTYCGT